MAYLKEYQNAERKPSFVIVGAAKAGITSLTQYLSMHPDIDISKKESFYFNSKNFEENYLPYPLQRGLDEIIFEERAYKQLFNGNTKRIIGEVGTGYLYHHEESISKIKKTLGKGVKIFILLRNPIDRAYSAYMHFKKDCFEDLSFEESLEMETYRKKQGWDFMWHYTSLGLYYEQVKAYLEEFNNVSILFFDDLKKDTSSFMNSLYAQLSIEPRTEGYNQVFNPSTSTKYSWLQECITNGNPIKSLLRPMLKRLFSSKEKAYAGRSLKTENTYTYHTMSDAAFNKLSEFYQEDVEKLSELVNRDLTGWLTREKLEVIK